jgi:hypothetical protein
LPGLFPPAAPFLACCFCKNIKFKIEFKIFSIFNIKIEIFHLTLSTKERISFWLALFCCSCGHKYPDDSINDMDAHHFLHSWVPALLDHLLGREAGHRSLG